MSTDTIQNMTEKYHEEVRKFERAVSILVLLDNKVIDLKTRYLRAKRDNRKSFSYTLHLQLVATKGMRDLFFEYLSRKSDAGQAMQNELMEAGVIIEFQE